MITRAINNVISIIPPRLHQISKYCAGVGSLGGGTIGMAGGLKAYEYIAETKTMLKIKEKYPGAHIWALAAVSIVCIPAATLGGTALGAIGGYFTPGVGVPSILSYRIGYTALKALESLGKN